MSNIEDIEKRTAERRRCMSGSTLELDTVEVEHDLDLAIAGWKEARADVRKLRGWLLRIPDSVPHFSYSDELRNDLADTAHHEQVRE